MKLVCMSALFLSACLIVGAEEQTLAERNPETNAVLTVACVGDSLTWSYGASDRKKSTYPLVLQSLLGEGWKVVNFGQNAATARDDGKEFNGKKGQGYRTSGPGRQALASNPDVVLFMLGTNDSKPINWETNGVSTKAGYTALVDSFRMLESKPIVVLATSPYVKKNSFTITGKTVEEELVPWQRAFADERKLPIVDAFEVTKAGVNGGYVNDGVHLNNAGYAALAQAFADKLRELEPLIRNRVR